jgi:cell division protein FtsI (penicillin-binding protein 3)
MAKVSTHILRRVYVLFGLFVLMSALIVLRILALQFNQSTWVQKQIAEKVSFRKVMADRGNILAEDGTIMATSLPFYRVSMDPTVLDTTQWENFRDSLYQLSLNFARYVEAESPRDTTVDTLAVYRAVRQAMAEGDRHLFLSRKKLNFKEMEQVQTWPIINRGRFEGGLVVEKFNNERYYPMEDLARITLGRIVDDTVAIRGIEYSFNQHLRGRDGYQLVRKVVGGSFMPLDHYGHDGAVDGYDVTTTLDVDMQEVVERALARGVERNYAKYGVAILMEVGTGKIKAIANYPETYNHAIATSTEPGSTFKTASAVALIEDGIVTGDSIIDTGEGKIMYDDKEVTDNGHVWGKISFEKVFAHSSNVGVSKTVFEAYDSLPDRYMQHLRNFGFFNLANLQIEGEPQPRVITPGDDEWTIATLPSLSYGYSLEVTPLQMATFYNGIANYGQLMRPWLVKEVRNNSKIVEQYGPEVINPQMCSPQTAEQVHRLMRAVVEYGTADDAFRGMPFLVAGKTGTARKTKIGVGYIRKYRASFGGFFPADKPRFTLYVMVDEPDGGVSSGGSVAAPIFRDIAEQVYRMDQALTRPPQRPDGKPVDKPEPRAVYAQSAQVIFEALDIPRGSTPDAEWLRGESNGHQVNFDNLHPEPDRIPDLRGMTGRDALRLLESLGLDVTIQGTGRVRRQSLLPGYKYSPDSKITLFLG